MKQGQIVTTEITGITSDGDGVGRVDNMAVFIPSAAVGDTVSAQIVKVGKSFASGSIKKIIKPSKDRVTPDCPVFGECGGCTFRHINYNAEAGIKENFVRDAFSHIAKLDVAVNPIVFGERNGYRNKAQYPFASDGRVGFFAKSSHRVVPCEDCLLQPKEFSLIAKAVSLFIKQYNITVYNEKDGRGLLRHLYMRITSNGDIMVSIVINGDRLPHSEALLEVIKLAVGDRLKSFQININREKTNVILGEKCITLYGDEYITDTVCSVLLRVSPLSFSQVNHDMAQKLYSEAVLCADAENKTVIDLYCGTGAIGLIMAKRAKSVIGVEIVPEAIEDAKQNAKTNGIDNIRFICADALKASIKLKNEGIAADTVVVDPPRKGCDAEVINIIANNFAPERVVYVSCNPATLARDCKLFSELGYKVIKVTPFDLFPGTAHVESVALLVRTDSAI